MSTVVTIDSTALELEAGKAYLFADNSGAETLYKYQLASGTTGNITTSVLTALGVSVDSLPVIVYQADLLRCLNETISSVDGVTIANDGKASASVEYVKRSVSNKLDKAEFLTKTAVMEKRIADLEGDDDGSPTPGGTTAPSSITEIYDTTNTTATVAVEDGKCYRFKQPLANLVVSSVERGLVGSSMLFKCQNRAGLADPTVVKIGAYGHWYYNSDNEFVDNYTAPHEWSLVPVDMTATGTNRVYRASFTGKDPGIEDPNNQGCAGGINTTNADWVLECKFDTTANRWQITGSYSYVLPGPETLVVTLAPNGDGDPVEVVLTKVNDSPNSFWTGILYRNEEWDISLVRYATEGGEYGMALVTGSQYKYYGSTGDALFNSVKLHANLEDHSVANFLSTYGSDTLFSNCIHKNGVEYNRSTGMRLDHAQNESVSGSNVIMAAAVGETEISTNTWASVHGGAYLPGGYGDNDPSIGGDGFVPSLRNAYVDIQQDTILLAPSVQFPASLNTVETKVFEANKAYFVSFWNNLLTVKEVALGSTGEV